MCTCRHVDLQVSVKPFLLLVLVTVVISVSLCRFV